MFCAVVRRVAVFGAALVVILSFSSLQALAKAGCFIGSVSPTSGSTAGGTTVTITGDFRFCMIGGIEFGGVAATPVGNTDFTITVTTGPHAAGVVDVVVDDFSGGITGVGLYTYTAATTGTPTDSTNVRTLQTSVTTTVANTSGAAITSAIDGGINDGFSSNGTPTGFGPGGGFVSFTAVPQSPTATRAEEAFAALSYAGTNKAPNFYKAPPRMEREWSAWADFRGTGWNIHDNNGTSSNQRGNQINITAGLGRRIATNTLVGMIVGYEHFKYDVAAIAGRLKGDGETVGGYFAQRLDSKLRFDAALAWSHLNYNATAGTATGSFTGSRWLASTGLTGNHQLGAYVLEPSAKLYVLGERDRSWTDSLGTLQAARSFSAGRTAVGGKVARSFAMPDGWNLSPYAGLYADWRFQSDTALPTGATPVANIGRGWSGRVTSGLSATSASGKRLSINGEYGGLGANYEVWSGNVRGSVPF